MAIGRLGSHKSYSSKPANPYLKMQSSSPNFPARYASDTTLKRALSDTDFEDDVPGAKRSFQPEPTPQSQYFDDLELDESMSDSDDDDWNSDDDAFLAPEGGIDEFERKTMVVLSKDADVGTRTYGAAINGIIARENARHAAAMAAKMALDAAMSASTTAAHTRKVVIKKRASARANSLVSGIEQAKKMADNKKAAAAVAKLAAKEAAKMRKAALKSAANMLKKQEAERKKQAALQAKAERKAAAAAAKAQRQAAAAEAKAQREANKELAAAVRKADKQAEKKAAEEKKLRARRWFEKMYCEHRVAELSLAISGN